MKDLKLTDFDISWWKCKESEYRLRKMMNSIPKGVRERYEQQFAKQEQDLLDMIHGRKPLPGEGER